MILMEGPPGAGKTVQAKLLRDRLGLAWISIGRVLAATVDDELLEMMKLGRMLPDKIVGEILEQAIDAVEVDTKIILDGFPRRQSQVEWFYEYLSRSQRSLEGVVHIMVRESEVQRRLLSRGRVDDTSKTISDRYEIYLNHITPMIDGFIANGIPVAKIDGEADIESVHERIDQFLSGVI